MNYIKEREERQKNLQKATKSIIMNLKNRVNAVVVPHL